MSTVLNNSNSTLSAPIKPWILSGSELSPFHLKIAAMLRFKGVPYRDFPSQGSAFDNIRIQLRLKLLRLGVAKLTYPKFTEMDEFPLVPFLFGPKGENIYDSSAIATWLDEQAKEEGEQSATDLVKASSDGGVNFLIQLIDDFFDEFGLYMVHHARWKMSVKDNDAGKRLSQEMPTLAAPFRPMIANFFSARQVRRCPYLFSVAPKGYQVDGVRSDRVVPSHEDFPATHELLETSYLNVLKALEPILSSRNFLLGNQFTLADASIYGQLGMNLTDPSAAQFIKDNAPSVFIWLTKIHQGDFSGHIKQAEQAGLSGIDDPLLKPLMTEIIRIYYPLMAQNEAAYTKFKAAGETLFNEPAFWKGRAIYSGSIDGYEFKSVAKSFQVKVWKNLKQNWSQLTENSRTELENIFTGIDPIT